MTVFIPVCRGNTEGVGGLIHDLVCTYTNPPNPPQAGFLRRRGVSDIHTSGRNPDIICCIVSDCSCWGLGGLPYTRTHRGKNSTYMSYIQGEQTNPPNPPTISTETGKRDYVAIGGHIAEITNPPLTPPHLPASTRSGRVSPLVPHILAEGIASPRLPMSALAEERTIAHVPHVTPAQYALTAEVQA